MAGLHLQARPALSENFRVGLLSASAVRRLATGLDLRPTKQRGQNFVTDGNTVRRIVSVAGVRPDDVVLEVGPGLGSLTLGLLEAAAHVVAVEIDPLLAGALPATVAEFAPGRVDALSVVEADALKIFTLPYEPTRVVANLPYNVSVPVLLHLLATFPGWHHGLVMVQAEVADRLAAGPGSKTYGIPSVKMSWYAETTRVGTVPPSVFWPVPNVDSILVSFARADSLPGSEDERAEVFALVDGAFGQRRKMLRQALAEQLGGSAAASTRLEAAGIDPTLRGEQLSMPDFVAIARAR